MTVDPADLLAVFLRGVLGHAGRKRSRRAANFLGGRGGWLAASTLLAGVGVAWGLYDAMKGQAAGGPGVLGAEGPPGGLPASAAGVAPMPPLPGTAAIPDDVLRIVRLAVSAARADGTLSPAERALILGLARDAGFEVVVERELAAPASLASIAAGVEDPARRRDLYVLAFTVVRADEGVSGAERIYLAQLAHQLGLDPAQVVRLEAETAATIDATAV